MHRRFQAAVGVADKAEEARDAALATVNGSDKVLDGTILALADACVTAKLGTRIKPFAGLSTYAPSALVDLGYARELVEVRKLSAAIRRRSRRARSPSHWRRSRRTPTPSRRLSRR